MKNVTILQRNIFTLRPTKRRSPSLRCIVDRSATARRCGGPPFAAKIADHPSTAIADSNDMLRTEVFGLDPHRV